MKNNLYNLISKILMACIFTSLTPVMVIADNYDTGRKIYEMSKEVDAYQKSRIDGTYIDYSVTPDWVKALWTLVIIGLVISFLIGAKSSFKDLTEKRKKYTVLGVIAVLIILSIPFALYYGNLYVERSALKRYQENDDAVQLQLLKETLNRYNAISNDENKNLLNLINGNDQIFFAGKINPSEILDLKGSTKITSGKYTVIACEMDCYADLLPKNHPISVRTRRVGFYLCGNSKQELLLTGFYFSYGSYHLEKYHAAAKEYLEKQFNTGSAQSIGSNKDIILHLIDDTEYSAGSRLLTDNNGLSFIWVKADKKGNEIGLDICGNRKSENAWEKSLF